MATHWPAETLFAQVRFRNTLQSASIRPLSVDMSAGVREGQATIHIDAQLHAAGWVVQDVAKRRAQSNPADSLLFSSMAKPSALVKAMRAATKTCLHFN